MTDRGRRICRSLALLIGIAAGSSSLAAPPTQWGTSYGGFSCAGCHTSDGLATTPPLLPPGSNIVPSGAAATSGTNLRTLMTSAGTMAGILAAPSLTDDELNVIRLYLVDVRDGRLAVASGSSTAFGTTAIGSAGSVQTFTITNEREAAAQFSAVPSGSNGEFTVVSGGTCPANTTTSIASGASCTVKMQFFPAGTGTRSGAIRFTLNSPTGVTAQQVSLPLSGTGFDPAPVYTASGFAALTSPGFSAATDSSQTICRTVSNTGLANALTISLSVGQASGASADYSNYYELDGLSVCPGGSPPLCVPAGSSVTGTTSIASGASCTLPIKFNPAKFGFAGGTGARSAKLTVTHNAPTAGTQASYTLIGNVTSGPEPAIGISTNPSASAGQVLPPAFAHQVVGTTSALWNDFLISNSGTADGLDITQVTSSNTAEFALTENCVAAPPLARLVGSSPTCTIGLTFTPLPGSAGLGQRCTTVTVQAAFSSNGSQAVTVCGTGVPVPVAQMTVTPATIAFGNRSIGGIYKPESLVIGNAAGATADLLVGAVTITGSGFAFVPDASACQSKTLAAGTSCTLQLQFTPDPGTPGASYSATVSIESNDPTTPHRTIALTATAVAYSVPALQWQPASTTLSFPDLVIAGQQSAAPLVATLANVDGPGAVDVQAVRLVGADASNFSISSCPALLYQGESCAISVRFLPGSGGLKTAQVQVVSATGVAPPLLTVQGQGVGGSSPYLIVSTDALAFGSVRIGARSNPLALTLAAGGDGVLRVTSIAIAAPFSVLSQTCPPVPFTLPLGSDCSVSVTFAPTSTSQLSAKLSIGTDSSALPLEVKLDGIGQEQADVSSGGCSMASGESMTDPTLWALAVLAMVAMLGRRKWRQPPRPGEQPRAGPP